MIKVECISKTIKGRKVLIDVDLTAEPGRVTGLSGVNGSGKTMLMRVISGLVRPTSGFVSVDGKRIGSDLTFPKSIGMLIEAPAFVDSYTGFMNLKLLSSIRNIVEEEGIIASIERVGLDPYDRKKYRKYSLGMKQRLGIAAAVFERPDVVLLDEPTNALDSKGIDILKSIVFEQKERGAVVMVTCHDDQILRDMADEIYFMDSGRVANHEVIEEKGSINE